MSLKVTYTKHDYDTKSENKQQKILIRDCFKQFQANGAIDKQGQQDDIKNKEYFGEEVRGNDMMHEKDNNY